MTKAEQETIEIFCRELSQALLQITGKEIMIKYRMDLGVDDASPFHAGGYIQEEVSEAADTFQKSLNGV
jgi:hypothetical protein